MSEHFTPIECGQCGAAFIRTGDNAATCTSGHAVTVSVDIAPNMDEGEQLAWSGDVLGYTS